MSFHDEFFEELLTLSAAIRPIRSAMHENLSEQTLLALECANSTLCTRALEILDDLVSDVSEYRRHNEPKQSDPIADVAQAAIPVFPSTTVPENTSSQPAPSDLAAGTLGITTGAQVP